MNTPKLTAASRARLEAAAKARWAKRDVLDKAAPAKGGNGTPKADGLPPHSPQAEAAALGCVLSAQTQAEVDELLLRLKPQHFYDLRHKTIHAEMTKLRMEGHAVDLVMLGVWLKDHNLMAEAGGLEYVAKVAADHAGLVTNFGTYLAELQRKSLLRWTLGKSARLAELAQSPELTPEQIKEELAELTERAGQVGMALPYLDIISPAEARAFVPDPQDALVGEGLISRGMIVTIAGDPGCGKSRLATTLAAAGARGTATWQGYPVRTKWKTLILQSENQGARLKEEFMAIPEKLDPGIKVSRTLSHGLAFLDPGFRRELRRFYEVWPFQLMVVDPWNDVSFDTSQKDYKEALLAIKNVFIGLPKRPAIVIVAHLRKQGRDDKGHATGRLLLHWISGSLALGSESRTVFAVQPVSHDMADDRIIFEVAKANDAHPDHLREYGTRSAWRRANGAFEYIPDFDWAREWDQAEDSARAITQDMVLQVWGEREMMSKTDLAKALEERYQVGYSTGMRAIGGYLAQMFQKTPQGWLELAEV